MDDTEFTFDLVPKVGDQSKFRFENEKGKEFRDVWVSTPNESSPLNMKIKLVEVHHGRMLHENKTWGGTLLLLEMTFLSADQERRYKSAVVNLEFFDKGSESKYHPAVIDLAPNRMHWLNKTTRERRKTYGANAGASGSAGPVGLEAGVHWQVETTEPTKYKATITGKSRHSAGYFGLENAVKWSITENKDERDGIPTFLQAAVLLRTHASRPFYAKMRVDSDVDIVSTARRGLPMTTDEDKVIDHNTFTPGVTQLWNTSVTGVTPADLESMEKLPVGKWFRVNMSEQDDLLAPVDAPTVAPQPVAGYHSAAFTGNPGAATILTPNNMVPTVPTSLAVIAEALRTAAEAAANAGEAATKSAEAAGKAAEAAVKVAEALSILTAAVKLEESGNQGL